MDRILNKCTKCDRELKELAFNKCMYCGEPIPENIQLTEDARLLRLKEKHNKLKSVQNAKNKVRRSIGSDGGGFNIGGGCGGDAGCGD
jgi:hypothetical protein